MAKTGRKPAHLPLEEVDKLLELYLRLSDIADFYNVSERTVERHIKKETGMRFVDYAEKKRSKGRRILMQKFWEKVNMGNMTAIIFGLKNIMDWHDNVKNTLEPQGFKFSAK